MKMHTSYMIALSALFATVFVVMIGSLIWHRQRCLRSVAGFSGLTGTHGAGQWFWALLPLLILAGINLSLLLPQATAQAKNPPRIKLAAATAQVEHRPAVGPLVTKIPADGHTRP